LIEDKYIKTTDVSINESKQYYKPVLGQNFTSYLKFPNNGGALINSSINSFKSSLEHFIRDETTYVLRIKCKDNASNGNYIEPSTIKICQYEDMDEFKIE
jgi:hypothetical protein